MVSKISLINLVYAYSMKIGNISILEYSIFNRHHIIVAMCQIKLSLIWQKLHFYLQVLRRKTKTFSTTFSPVFFFSSSFSFLSSYSYSSSFSFFSFSSSFYSSFLPPFPSLLFSSSLSFFSVSAFTSSSSLTPPLSCFLLLFLFLLFFFFYLHFLLPSSFHDSILLFSFSNLAGDI